MGLKILTFPLREKVIERHLYSLANVLFRNIEDAERAKDFLNFSSKKSPIFYKWEMNC